VSPVQLAVSYLRARPLWALQNVLLLALGIGTIGFVLIVDREAAARFERDARGIDLVVGAKGSPLQLILAGVYHLDVPSGNIPLAAQDTLSRDPLVRSAIPLSLGDSFRGFRIAGTTPDYVALYGGVLASGAMWNGRMQAVLGSAVASRTGLHVGDRFAGSHGLSEGGPVHGDAIYTVVGVLQPTGTVLDRLVLVDLESVWFVHEGEPADAAERTALEAERQVTVLLVRYASPLAAATLPRRINEDTNLQAASPAYESARLMQALGAGAGIVRAFGAVVILTAALSLFISLSSARKERAYDIAVLRTLGARPHAIAQMLLAEALLLAIAGGVAGLLLAHALAAILAAWLSGRDTTTIDPWTFTWSEAWLLVPALAAALAAAALPSVRAARADIAATLARR
jgi:putative ABC transport system permease protein